MNYCTKCQSFYREPGTCNCYAVPRVPVVPIDRPDRTDTPYPFPYTPTVDQQRCGLCGGPIWICRGTHVYCSNG